MALSVRHLSRKDSSVLGFFGAGRRASTQINAVLNERPGIREVRLCGRTPSRRDAAVWKWAYDRAVEKGVGRPYLFRNDL